MASAELHQRRRAQLVRHFGGVCGVCETTNPTLTKRSYVDGWEFDHLDHALMRRRFKEISHRPWEEILAWVVSEGVQLLCSTCHQDKSTYEMIGKTHRR